VALGSAQPHFVVPHGVCGRTTQPFGRRNPADDALRGWVADGLIEPVLLPSGHRRYNAADLDRVLRTASRNARK
jgi:hypothetical protein